MCRHRSRGLTRRAALALLHGICLATIGPACSPAEQAPGRGAQIPDRLDKMRALRGTGDPRLPRNRSTVAAERQRGPRR
jgi:hypothetical protein